MICVTKHKERKKAAVVETGDRVGSLWISVSCQTQSPWAIQMLMTRWRVIRSNLLYLLKFSRLYAVGWLKLICTNSNSFHNRSNQSQGISEEIATAVFSITPNPIVNEINENANPANAATSSLTVVPVKILPDYCPPAEDAPCGQSAILVRMCLGKKLKALHTPTPCLTLLLVLEKNWDNRIFFKQVKWN